MRMTFAVQSCLCLVFCLTISVSYCCESDIRSTTLRAIDAARLQIIDDKVRFSLNATLSNDASLLIQRLNQIVAEFDDKCDAEIENLGAECTKCADTACIEPVEKKPKLTKVLVSKLKDGIKKITNKVKESVKKIGKSIGTTVKKAWRRVGRVIRRTVRVVSRVVRQAVSRTIRNIGSTIRRVGRVVRRVGNAIRRVASTIRRVVRVRVRFGRRWGKRNTDTLPACALNCEACRTLANSQTEDVCGSNDLADQLIQRLLLMEEALNATHDDSRPMIAKVEINGQLSEWINNDMFFSEVYVTANIKGELKKFKSSKSLPMMGDVTEFANAASDEIWKKYNEVNRVQV